MVETLWIDGRRQIEGVEWWMGGGLGVGWKRSCEGGLAERGHVQFRIRQRSALPPLRQRNRKLRRLIPLSVTLGKYPIPAPAQTLYLRPCTSDTALLAFAISSHRLKLICQRSTKKRWILSR